MKPALSKGILEDRKKIAITNLSKYPIIKSLFHEDWILEQINNLNINEEEGVNGHGLAWLLSNQTEEKVIQTMKEYKNKLDAGDKQAILIAYPLGASIYEPLLNLAELEKNLDVLKNESGIKNMIKKAKNGDQFWHTLSEIEVAAYFKRNGLLKAIEPLIEGKTPDLLVNLDGRDFCIEIFTPMLAQKLEAIMGKIEAISLGNRAIEKIDEKINQLPKSLPSIIVINRAFSEIDLTNVVDAIFGSLSLLLPKDVTSEPISFRKKDGLIHSRDLSNIKAIVLYKRVFDFNNGLVTIPEIKKILIKDGDNITEKQEAILSNIFKSMIFNIDNLDNLWVRIIKEIKDFYRNLKFYHRIIEGIIEGAFEWAVSGVITLGQSIINIPSVNLSIQGLVILMVILDIVTSCSVTICSLLGLIVGLSIGIIFFLSASYFMSIIDPNFVGNMDVFWDIVGYIALLFTIVIIRAVNKFRENKSKITPKPAE